MWSSFVAAMKEFQAEGRGEQHDWSLVGRLIRDDRLASERDFGAFVADLRSQAVAEPAPGRVRSTMWWWCEGDEYLGNIAVRHTLTDQLRKIGGHIGYDVRPTARRQGHATAMLAAALPCARALGIESALITCDRTTSARGG
jgi:predicted acetyltransferase